MAGFALDKVCIGGFFLSWYKYFMSRSYIVSWAFDSCNYNYSMGVNGV